MANEEHLSILKQGITVWNEWRKKRGGLQPNLSNVNLAGADLSGVNFVKAHLQGANLERANLSGTNFYGAKLDGSILVDANLSRARLTKVTLNNADISGANFSNADIDQVNFYGANLRGADFRMVRLLESSFSNVDLSMVKNLETVRHDGPSSIGIDTLYLSRGMIPEVFLRECGVPDEFITFAPSILDAQKAIQFYSCFISYSHKDEEFARRLHSRMREEHLRVWFAPEDIQGGRKLHEQIDRAIQVHDRLLVVLSENSLQSEWVITEIRRARKVELIEKRQKLFPIKLVSFEALRDWECFDAESGKDLAIEVREYFIPDFSHWKDHDAFETAFSKLLKDLRAAE